MKKYIVLNKKIGETPLMAVRTWKVVNPKYTDISACYAGRLDPMAEGKLLVLLGNECKKQERYTKLDKEYNIEVLLDVGSDTGDALGLVDFSKHETRVDPRVLQTILRKELGTHKRAYPAFSSKTVMGKPLFLHALEKALPYMVVPEHEEHIYTIRHLGSYTLSKDELEKRIQDFLMLVPKTTEPSKALGADFRINEVQASWERLFNEISHGALRNFTVLKLQVVCGSGTYMRSLAGRVGEALGTKGLALRITRTKIGKYWKGLWMRYF